MPTILVIDDNEAVFEALDLLFSLEDIETRWAETPAQGLARLATHDYDLVIQDMNFSSDTTSGMEGIELFRSIREKHPDMPIILLTAWTHLEQAVDLVRDGAADYLGKPWDDDKLVATVRNLLQLGQLSRENRRLTSGRNARRAALAEKFDLCDIVYASDAMHELVSVATRVARSELPVLITGPNGAGKEMIADIVQRNSSVADGPYLKVNVGALPPDLLEAELFGAEAGAYTGATKAREGRFEAADKGTLFLDEIGNLSPAGQMKLLRVLQTGEFERLGSTKTRKVSVRVISATNANLAAAIERGEFREDLFYRLNVIELALPPLAERRDDILPVAESLLPAGRSLTSAAQDALVNYDWPGNVRELRNQLQRALVLANGTSLDAGDFNLPRANRKTEPDAQDLRAALEANNGVIAAAAKSLGLSRQAFYRRMEKFDISDNRADSPAESNPDRKTRGS